MKFLLLKMNLMNKGDFNSEVVSKDEFKKYINYMKSISIKLKKKKNRF